MDKQGYDYIRYKQLLAEAVDETRRLELIETMIRENARDRLEAQQTADRVAMMAMTVPVPAADLPCSVAKLIVPWAAGGDTDIINRAVVEAVNRSGVMTGLRAVKYDVVPANAGTHTA